MVIGFIPRGWLVPGDEEGTGLSGFGEADAIDLHKLTL